MVEFVVIPENPAPEFADVFYYRNAENQQMRGMIAFASSQFPKPRGTIILCPGRTEFVEKYFEVVRDLQKRGFCVVAFDWPGQGLSYKLLKDPLVGHIDDFDSYVAALRLGLNAVEDKTVGPYVLLSHSMGGGIALEALRQQAVEVEAAAFCAPLWGLHLNSLANPLIRTMCALGLKKRKAHSHKHVLENEFDTNILTHDENRWAIQQLLIGKNSALALGAVTWGWLDAVLNVTKRFTKPNVLDHLQIPILVASGSEEKLVDNKSHALMANRIKSAEHIIVKGARHEILMETNAKRDQFFKAFDRMLDRAGI